MTYTQLDPDTIAILTGRATELGSRAAVARELGVSRSAISQAIDGRYPGDTGRIKAKIIERYAEAVACPHLGRDIPPTECRRHRSRPTTSASPTAFAFARACRACVHNPDREARPC
jgi:DNA-binding transcriptional regulator YdaS (Cro superfamily)